tara:strand:- start:2183 stop:2329 length:147 start_codon:yes stop_codon:yes gene_type:complete
MSSVQVQGLVAARNKQLRSEREFHAARLRELNKHKETTFTYRGVPYTK